MKKFILIVVLLAICCITSEATAITWSPPREGVPQAPTDNLRDLDQGGVEFSYSIDIVFDDPPAGYYGYFNVLASYLADFHVTVTWEKAGEDDFETELDQGDDIDNDSNVKTRGLELTLVGDSGPEGYEWVEYSYTGTVGNGSVKSAKIPEPATMAIFGLGGLGLAVRRKFLRKA